ncbi:hypothetical protein [Mesorhizobium amorphae]|uniref:hypothetical protein n=1 Tax=Mesorhizobium amorphae TaxID=71433 RepID=UPI001780B144
MEEIATIGSDIAKEVFQVDGIDAAGAVVVRRKLRRDDVVRFRGCVMKPAALATAANSAVL